MSAVLYSSSFVISLPKKLNVKVSLGDGRNIVLRSFSKIVKNISKEYDKKYSDEQIKEIAKSPQFQNSIVEIMKGNRNV